MNSEGLPVYLFETRIGTLKIVRNGARFEFIEDLIAAREGSPLLSTALLVRRGSFDVATTAAWFSGLLPEDSRLEEARRFYGIDGESYLDVLREIGWECAGAVSVLPEGSVPSSKGAPGGVKLSIEELSQRLKALPAHPFDTSSSMRISLGGFQEKLCVLARRTIRRGGKIDMGDIEIPLDGSPTTHILKPQPDRFPCLAEAEAWAMTVASTVTPTAEVGILDSKNTEMPQTLVVTRFDRVKIGDSLVRVHQEDCCQALGIPSGRKYAAESSPKKSDPSFKKIAELLSSYSADAHGELLTLLRQMVVNVVLGNTDAHAKNYAIFHKGDGISLAPLYDVVPAQEITPTIHFMGMRIAGRIRIDGIGRNQIIEEACSWGLRKKECEAVLDDALVKVVEGIEYANELYPEAGKRHTEPTKMRIDKLSRDGGASI